MFRWSQTTYVSLRMPYLYEDGEHDDKQCWGDKHALHRNLVLLEKGHKGETHSSTQTSIRLELNIILHCKTLYYIIYYITLHYITLYIT